MSLDRSTLQGLVLRGSSFTIASHGAGQLIRLARSLVLTRLLFPEAFGVMSLVWVAMYGLAMISDIGTGPVIIRDKRGDDPVFLNTAWTLQVIRGAVLWGVAGVIAYPMAVLYSEPDLFRLIPVAALTVLIAGFNSTAMHTCRRRMELGKLAVLEVANEILAFLVTVLWAHLDPTVWALVGGALVSQLFLLLGSHAYLTGMRNHFQWEPDALGVLISFGKWIYWGSVFQFVASQSDRLLLGRFLDMAYLGVYSIAIMLSEAVQVMVSKLIRGVLLPAYGRVLQQGPDRLPYVLNKARIGIDVMLVMPIAALMVLGDRLVGILYDARYQEAGWMLQVLCVRLLMSPALINSEICLFAMGHPRYGLVLSASRAAWILASIPVGWYLAGVEGIVWAVALSELPVLAVLWIGMARHGMFALASELRSVLFAGLGALLGYGILRHVA